MDKETDEQGKHNTFPPESGGGRHNFLFIPGGKMQCQQVLKWVYMVWQVQYACLKWLLLSSLMKLFDIKWTYIYEDICNFIMTYISGGNNTT